MAKTALTSDDKFAVFETVLASAVADSGTFTIAYPTGFVQTDFTAGLMGSTHYMVVNDNDKWTAAASKMSVSAGASTITVTNSTGASLAAGSRVRVYVELVDGNDVMLLTLPITLASITGAGDVVTEIRPGVDGTIENVEFVVTVPVTTGSKAATLNLEIDTTNVTGGTVALTSAACTPLGAVVAGAAITAENRLYRKSKLSVEAASVTAFAEGAGYLLVRIRRTPNI